MLWLNEVILAEIRGNNKLAKGVADIVSDITAYSENAVILA